MPFIVPIKPDSGERGAYNRLPSDANFTLRQKRNTIEFAVEGSFNVGAHASSLTIDGVVVTPPVPAVSGRWRFEVDIEHGAHVIGLANPPAGHEVIEKPILVLTDGTPIDEAWVAPTRMERTQSLGAAIGPGAVKVKHTGRKPQAFGLKKRASQAFSGRRAGAQIWTRAIAENTGWNVFIRRWRALPDGSHLIEPEQTYFYGDIQGINGRVPNHPLRDGGVGEHAYGHHAKHIRSPQDTGDYLVDILGSVRFLNFTTRVFTTLAGWREKPGMEGAPVTLRHFPAKPPTAAERAFYESRWEYVGDWSLVRGPKTMAEPWGLASKPTPGETGLHEFWVTDTRNHRILYINHCTAHDAADPCEAAWTPKGYVQPAPFGQSQVVVLVDREMLMEQGFTKAEAENMLDEPWGAAHRKKDDRLYWTNFGSSTVCSIKWDGTEAKIVFGTTRNVSNTELGITQRLYYGMNSASVRNLYYQDADAKSILIRPQAIVFDENDDPVWVERYVFTLRRGNVEAGTIKTLRLLPMHGTSHFQFDVNLEIDLDGSFGAVGDIFVSGWHNTDYRYDRNGGLLANAYQRPFWQQSGGNTNNGLQNYSKTPGYGWGMSVGSGRAVFQGNAGGSQISDYTATLPSDPKPNLALFNAGHSAFRFGSRPSMQLTHGAYGFGHLGFATFEEMGAWTDDKIKAYWRSCGVAETSLAAAVYLVRWRTVDVDYSVPVPDPDHSHDPVIDFFTAEPVEIIAGESVRLAWGTTNATKVYVNGTRVLPDGEVDYTPATDTTYKLTTEGTSPTTVERTIVVKVKPPLTEVERLRMLLAERDAELARVNLELVTARADDASDDAEIAALKAEVERLKLEDAV